jgi:transposase
MSLEVNMKDQTKRPNPRYTLEFKQDAAKIVSKQDYTLSSRRITLSAIGSWSRAERGSATPSTTKTVDILDEKLVPGAS